jgi:hypothetical protein
MLNLTRMAVKKCVAVRLGVIYYSRQPKGAEKTPCESLLRCRTPIGRLGFM